MGMNAKEIAHSLDEIASLLEIRGDNPFRCRAFRNGAQVVEGLTDLEARVKAGTLTEIKGIGAGLAEEITQLSQKGQSPLRKELLKEIPESILEILAIPGLGPKKIKVLFADLKITNLGELEYACKENRLLDLKGFGRKTQDNVLKGIALLKRSAGRFLFDMAWETAMDLKDHMKKKKGVEQIEVAGSLRRHKETIGDIDILISTKAKSASIMKAFREYSEVEDILLSGETKTSVRLKNGMQADLRVISPKEFPFALVYFTGSKEHNTHLRKLAKSKGLKLNEYGLFKGKKSVACKDEKAIYQALGLSFIPPELREDRMEFQLAKKKPGPKLIQEKDIRGVFHTHTTWSDGSASILDMAKATKKLGWEYMGLSDHSQTAFYAGGLKPAELTEQAKELKKVGGKLKGLSLFHGTESDILTDGHLDYKDAALKKLDFVIASIHSGFKLGREKMTQRILKAIKNPYTRFIGHISGRLLLAREGYDLDYSKIFSAAAKEKVIIEINANPHRFDLDWRFIGEAREAGVKFSINPDAHSTEGLEDTWYGVGIARKGGLTPEDVINTRSAQETKKFLSSPRKDT